tara:strand:- start:246 stop:464 length:219 start_codon:yes stop_codon:yes gene_type:complete
LKKSVFYRIYGERFAQEEIPKNLSLIGFMMVLMLPQLRSSYGCTILWNSIFSNFIAKENVWISLFCVSRTVA